MTGKILDMHGNATKEETKETTEIKTHVVPAIRLFFPTEGIPHYHEWKLALTITVAKQEYNEETKEVRNEPLIDQGTTFILTGSNAEEMADRLKDEIYHFLDEIMNPPMINPNVNAKALDAMLPGGIKGDKDGR